MNCPHVLKIALITLVLSINFCIKNYAGVTQTNFLYETDSLEVDSDHSRHTIAINNANESIVLTNLEVGSTYHLWISSQEIEADCNLGFFQNQKTGIGEDQMELIAQHEREKIIIQYSNFKNKKSLFATLSISKAEIEEESNALSLMGISTSGGQSAQELIEDVLIGGGCFDISNVQAIGNTQGMGTFSSGTSSISLETGVILASGNIANSAGPNNVTNITTDFFDGSGDIDLNTLANGSVFDAVGIEFDFTPVVNTIEFNYVFASDEYCDYVFQNFSDVFGFFISGPGFNGPYSNGGENIALVPGTGQEVSIDAVNIQSNAAYYVDNVPIGQPQNANGCVPADLNNPGAAEMDIEYDGFTTVLTATANVQACETYHIRMVVGDVNDGIFDSAVFLEANSFNLGGDVSMDIDLPGLGATGIAYEGCQGDGYIIFERPADSNISLPVDVYFTVSSLSTATDGQDYSSLPPFITIPAGQTQFLLPLSIYEDFITEGTETLILELDNPCTCQDAAIEILISDVPELFVETPDLEFCNETSTTLFADVFGGVPGYSYQWSNGSTNPTTTIDAITGTQIFTVTVTDECGNGVISTSTVTVAEEAYAIIEGFAEVCEGNPTGLLTVTFTGMGPWDLTYLIDGIPQPPIIGITQNPYFLLATELGTYTIGGIFVNGCPGIGDGSGIILPTIFNSFVIPDPVSCAGNFDGSIDLLMTGGSPEYSYAWSNGLFTEDIDNLGPGIYTVTVTDMNGCTHIDSAEILASDSIIANIVPIGGVDCLDSLSGSADLTVNGGTPGYTYLWDNGSTEEDPTNLSAGLHTVMVTDSLGCTSEAVVTISQDALPPIAEATVVGILTCDELMVSIDGSNSSGGDSLSFVWLDGNGMQISTDTITNVENTGSYTLVVTNLQNGCSAETAVSVDENITPPVPNAIGGILNCNETEIMLDASGSTGAGTIGYSWLDNNGMEIGTSVTQNVMEPGTYTLVITDDSNGCTESITVEVEQEITPPVPVAEPSGILNCDEIMVSIDGAASTGSGTITYQWLAENGDSLSTESQIDVSDAGTYTLIITDGQTGCTAEISAMVEQDIQDPIPEAIAAGPLGCLETVVLLNGAGSTGTNITYQWLDGVTEIGVESEVEVANPGTYTLIITDTENGCTAQTEVEVIENIEEPNPEATVSGILTCETGLVTLDGTTSSGAGVITYQWLDAGGIEVSTDPNFEVENIGTYTLIITDDFNGCTAQTQVTVDENMEEPIADPGENGMLNCDEISAILDASASSTGDNISYEWLNESNVNIGSEVSIEVSEAGTFTLIVTNEDNGCTSTAQVQIEADANVPEVDAIVDGVIDCNNASSIIDGSASSGNGTITYQWIDENDQEISVETTTTVTEPGIYTLIITDTDNGCVSQMSVEVLENMEAPQPDVLDPELLTCETMIVELNASNSTASGNVIFEWQDSDGIDLGNEAMLEVETPGTYVLIITNGANGCTEETSVEVLENIEIPNPQAIVDGVLTCEVLNLELDGSASTGLGTLGYEWFDPSNISIGSTSNLEIEAVGIYTLMITDAENGCTALTTVEVDQDITDPVALPEVDGLLNCTISSAFLNGNASTGTNDLDYQWLDSNGIAIGDISEIEVTDQGTFTLVVTDQMNGCSNESTVIVDANFNTPQVVVEIDGILTCENLSVLLDGSSSSSNGELSYQWLDGNSVEIGVDPLLDVSLIGTYTLVITDLESTCTESITVEVEEDILPPLANAGPPNTLTCDTETVTLNGAGSSTGNNISYVWTNAGNVTVSTEITAVVDEAGEYTLVVTNENNGCTALSTVLVVPDENLPTADAGPGSLLTCDILEATLSGFNSSAGSNISYQWLDANDVPLNEDLEITVNEPGTYTLIVMDTNNGCSTSSSVEVSQNIDTPQAIPGNSPTLTCEETEALLDGSGSISSMGDLTYEWFDNNDITIGTDSTVTVNMAGVYTLLVTAENGCEHTSTVEVLLDTNVPIADPGTGGILDCNVSIITLGSTNTTSGNTITYQWLNSNNEIVGTEQFFETDIPDTYTLVVFNSANNCETSAQAIIDQDVLYPQVDVGMGGLLTCEETEIILGGSGTSSGFNFEYEWTNMNGQVVSNDSVYVTNNPGTYTLTVFNTENGCEISETIVIDQNIESPIADAGEGGILTCDVSEITLDAGASSGQNISYQWLNESGAPIANEPQIQVSETGIYTIIITNNINGCSSEDEVEVVPDENIPTAIATEIGVLNCNVSEVLIDAGSSSSVSGNIDFEWLDPNEVFLSNDADLMVGMPGVYTVIVTDTDNGCTTSASVEVPQDIENPEAIAGENDTLTCLITQVQLNGSANNGVDFSYEWFDNNNDPVGQSADITVGAAGQYTLVVTNLENGCSASDQVEIIPDADLPVAVAVEADVLTCAVGSVILDASNSEQGPTISYEWQDSNNTPISEDLQVEVTEPGVYTIIVTNNENNCVSQDLVTVEEDVNDPLAAIDGIGPLELNCDNNAVVLNGENSVPFSELIFAWSTTNGNITTDVNNSEIEVNQTGTYELLVTNVINGCTDTQVYNVDENFTPPSLFITPPDVLNCYVSEINLNGVNTSGNGNFEYTWTAANGIGIVSADDLEATVNAPGTYVLNILNLENGCDESTEVIVEADLETPDAVATVDDQLDCVTPSITLDGTGSSTGFIFNYQWQGSGIVNGGNTLTPTVNEAGPYSLLVTNIENGCTEIENVFVLADNNVPAGFNLEIIPPPCPGDVGSIEILNVLGGEEPYVYSIDGGENFYDVTYFFSLDPGSYELVVQDVKGCEYEEFVNIPYPDDIAVELDLDLEISLGDTVQLQAFSNIPEWALSSIVWTPSSTLSCDDCLEPYAFPHQTTTYTITISNENGCPATDDITLRVRKDRGIYIPNVFSPLNDDGINDIFHIFSDMKTVKNISTFQVFDRWGELIFEDYDFMPDDPAHGWDGMFRGEPMNPAVFVYWAAVEFIDGEVIIFKGDVTLVR